VLPSRKRAVLHQYRRGTLQKRLRSTQVMRNSDMRLARLIVRGTPTASSPKAQTRRKKLATPQLPGLLRRAPIWPASTPACLAGPRVAKAYDDDLVLGFGRIESQPGPRRPIRPPKPRHVVENGGEQIDGNVMLRGRVPPRGVAFWSWSEAMPNSSPPERIRAAPPHPAGTLGR